MSKTAKEITNLHWVLSGIIEDIKPEIVKATEVLYAGILQLAYAKYEGSDDLLPKETKEVCLTGQWQSLDSLQIDD